MLFRSAGVRIFEYSPGFIHEKALVFDDREAIIGTINLDYRSLVHHFECAVLMIGSPEVIRVREGISDALSKAAEITESEARLGVGAAIIKTLIRLFAPLL